MRCVRAFSLIELVLVVAIVAILGAIAIPRFAAAQANSTARATDAGFIAIERAALSYADENRVLPPDQTAGAWGSEFRPYIDVDMLNRRGPAIGGQWDWDGAPWHFGTQVGGAVVGTNNPTTTWAAFDALIDDGAANTGTYRYSAFRLWRPAQ